MSRLLSACAAIALLSCTIEPMPFSITPREMVLPYLEKECLRAAPKQSGVRLESAGKAPRKRLRFLNREVSAQILVLEPPFTEAGYVVETEWLNAGIRGQGCHEFEVWGPKTEHIGDPVVGVAGVTTFGSTSFSTDALDEKSFVVERDLYWSLDPADPLLPSQPVGEGATWRLAAEGTRGGERLEIDATYRLARLEGTHVVLEVVRVVRRPAQRLRGPQGYSKRVQERTTRRLGVLDFDIRSRPFPNARFFDPTGKEVLRVMTAYR